MTSQYQAWLDESGAHEWGPGGQKSASEQIDLYEKSNKRQKVKDFLGNYGKKLDENLKADARNRSSNTESAQGQSSSSSSSKDSKDKVQSGMANLGKDIAIQRGFRGREEIIAGTPGRKGFLGTAVKTGLSVAFPGVGSTIANAAIGDRLDYM